MSSPHNAQEKFEDAWFSLMMYKIAQEDGRIFCELNEQLKNDSGFSISQEAHQRCLNTIENAFCQTHRKKQFTIVRRVIVRCIVAALIASLLLVTSYAVFPRVRTAAHTLLIKVSDVSTRLAMETPEYIQLQPSDDPINIIKFSDYYFPDIFPGFHVSIEYEDSAHAYLRYENETGAFLQIEVIQYNSSLETWPSDSDPEILSLEGAEIKLSENDGQFQALWASTDFLFSVTTANISKEPLRLWLETFLKYNSFGSLSYSDIDH